MEAYQLILLSVGTFVLGWYLAGVERNRHERRWRGKRGRRRSGANEDLRCWASTDRSIQYQENGSHRSLQVYGKSVDPDSPEGKAAIKELDIRSEKIKDMFDAHR